MAEKRVTAALCFCVLAACAAAARGNLLTHERLEDGQRQLWDGETKEEETRKEAFALSGTLRMAGSTSMARLAEALAEGFMEKYPDVTVTVEFTGSGAGIEAVADGSADVGNSSRALSEREKAKGVTENIVALDGIAVCVDRDNPVDGLTREQLAQIYTGEVNNWSELGGKNLPVVLVGREAGSGTRSAFEALSGVEGRCAYTNELDSSGAVAAKVASTPGAIGYISLETADERVKLLALDGVQPTAESVKTGDYPLSRPCIMATKGGISRQNRLVQVWFDYVLGEEGREITEKIGLAAVR